jgi:hypothetical protein
VRGRGRTNRANRRQLRRIDRRNSDRPNLCLSGPWGPAWRSGGPRRRWPKVSLGDMFAVAPFTQGPCYFAVGQFVYWPIRPEFGAARQRPLPPLLDQHRGGKSGARIGDSAIELRLQICKPIRRAAPPRRPGPYCPAPSRVERMPPRRCVRAGPPGRRACGASEGGS